MKQNIHPKYGEAKVTCACGNSFMSGSVNPELRVDVCSKCHPFFTGQQRNLAARGRIEKFNKRYNVEENNYTHSRAKALLCLYPKLLGRYCHGKET